MSPAIRRICVFCGSSAGRGPEFADAARAAGALLARRKIGIVFGGGHVGSMGAVADGALAAGGEVIGVIPRALETLELAHRGVADMRVVASMHERKQLMHDLSDAFVALPGGLGTLDELFETLTWSQLGFHAKPVGLVNVSHFFDPLLAYLDAATSHGFIRDGHRGLLLVDATLEGLLAQFERWRAPEKPKYIRREET
jgi:uncharacterized protein (TIGR00730 family)